MEITRRYRVNVSTNVKGIKSYDCTVEVTASPEEWNKYTDGVSGEERIRRITIEESDALVVELDKRYPPAIEEKK